MPPSQREAQPARQPSLVFGKCCPYHLEDIQCARTRLTRVSSTSSVGVMPEDEDCSQTLGMQHRFGMSFFVFWCVLSADPEAGVGVSEDPLPLLHLTCILAAAMKTIVSRAPVGVHRPPPHRPHRPRRPRRPHRPHRTALTALTAFPPPFSGAVRAAGVGQ